jgi:pimeloyl-ACP methyl ester carboxylesterase
MTKFIKTPHGSTIAYNKIKGEKVGIVFLSGFNSDMQGKKALYIENWAKKNNHSFLRFDYSGHGQSSGKLNQTCFSDWYNDAQFIINSVTEKKQILIGSSMGGWIMLKLAKKIPEKVSSIIGLAAAPDFPKVLIWDKMNLKQKRELIKNKGVCIKNDYGSENFFSYDFIKDSFDNLVLTEDIFFNGPVFLYHGMQDTDVPYNLSTKISNRIIGTKNIKILLEKYGGHRLSEDNQLQTIINLIKQVKKLL